MADAKISQDLELTELTGNELFPVVVNNSNRRVRLLTLQEGLVTSPVTKTTLGIPNVENTTDANKPVSTATAAALALKADTTELAASLATKAATVHAHVIADVTGLQAALNDKASHSEMTSAITALIGTAPTIADTFGEVDVRMTANEGLLADLTTTVAGKATTSAMNTALALKADASALAAKADVSALNTKADATTTTTALADKASLAALALKADITSVALKADATALALKADNAALALKADTTALALKADTTALISKADVVHTHVIADTTGLQAALDTKQTAAQVNTAIQAVVGAAPDALNTLVELATQLSADEGILGTLITTVGGKAENIHVHAIADVSGLQTVLSDKVTHAELATALTGTTLGSSATIADMFADVEARFVTDEGIATALAATVNGKADALTTEIGLASKAATSTVNTALALKADKTDIATINLELANKASVGALALKLDTGTLLDGLATKAPIVHQHVVSDIPGLGALLDTKVGAGDVNAIVTAQVTTIVDAQVSTALSTKADTSALTSGLALKADAVATTTSFANRLRVDVSTQGLTTQEKTNAKTNLGIATVDGIAEGTTNLYFTEPRVLNTIAAGVVFTDVTAPTAANSIKVFLGKVWGILNAHIGNVSNPHSTTAAQVGAAATSHTHVYDISFAVSDETTSITVGTNKIKFAAAKPMTITKIKAYLSTPQATGVIFTFTIKKNGTTILSTNVTIDNTESTNATAATPCVISNTAIAEDDVISVDVTQVGDGTAKGLKVSIVGTAT